MPQTGGESILSDHCRELILDLPQIVGNSFEFGKVSFTLIGMELFPLCGSKPVEGFREYVMDQWKEYLPWVATG